MMSLCKDDHAFMMDALKNSAMMCIFLHLLRRLVMAEGRLVLA